MNQIEAYRAVLQSHTTLAAASLLGISQSAVSRRISQLEASLGIALFVRDKTRLVPTRESDLLERHLSSLLDNNERVRKLVKEIGSGNSGSIVMRVAVPNSLSLSIIPDMVAEFLATHDRVQIELHTGPYDTIERMLLDGRAEIGFLRLPLERPGLAVTPLMQVRTVCVVPIDHPWLRETACRSANSMGSP